MGGICDISQLRWEDKMHVVFSGQLSNTELVAGSQSGN